METIGTSKPIEAIEVHQESDYRGIQLAVKPTEAVKRLEELQAFVKLVMKPSTPGKADGDYGTIPGTDKMTLLQPGAQKLCEVYGFSQSFDFVQETEDWDKPLFYYRVKCTLRSRRDGSFVGEGIGSCNSREKKYAGRWVFESEIPKGLSRANLKTRSGKSKKNGKPYEMFFVPNDEIFDLINTLQKMACKRALVMATIGATRSAGLFTQDIGDPGDDDYAEEEAPPQRQQHAPMPPGIEPKPAEQQHDTHHKLRMSLTLAKSSEDLDEVKILIGKAYKDGYLSRDHMTDLVDYGKACRAKILIGKGKPAADEHPDPGAYADPEDMGNPDHAG